MTPSRFWAFSIVSIRPRIVVIGIAFGPVIVTTDVGDDAAFGMHRH
jgi:hypothetical protein